jgi:hypothetical protein
MKALLLHFTTQEIYEIPQTEIISDNELPIHIQYEKFVEMASYGAVSGERLLHHAIHGGVSRGFTAENVVVLRLKTARGCDPAYIWAVRMTTTVPANCRIPTTTKAAMGQEFLWMWPLGHSYNAWLVRKDCIRRDPSFTKKKIDDYPPAAGYLAAIRVVGPGPDDFYNTTLASHHDLLPIQRYFLTWVWQAGPLFEQTATNAAYSNQVRACVDMQQRAAPDRRNRTHAEDSNLKIGTSSRVAGGCGCGCGCGCGVEARNNDNAQTAAKRQDAPPSRVKFIERLPSELIVKILATRLGTAIIGGTAEASIAIASLRGVSRMFRDTTEVIIAMQIERARHMFKDLLSVTMSATPHEIGSHLRSMGLNADKVLRISNIQGSTLPPIHSLIRGPTELGSWKSYLRVRDPSGLKLQCCDTKSQKTRLSTLIGDLVDINPIHASLLTKHKGIVTDTPTKNTIAFHQALLDAVCP